ncbi:MAG: tetratricopeptide repeat protein [Micromonosporaceae bacterium]
MARLGDRRVMQALARNAIGWCHTLLGEHEEAIVHCHQALAELRDLGERVSMSDVLGSLGRAHSQLGRYRQAVDYYQQAIDWCHQHGDGRDQAVKLIDLGDTYHTAGDHAAARDAWQRALHLLDEIGHPDTDKLRKRIAELG